MDPASIVGTTSAIVSFVQFSAKVISTAIEIRDNAGQATKSNQDLGHTLKEFDSRLGLLRSQLPPLRMDMAGLSGAADDAQMSLLRCSAKCEDLGSKIAALLDKIGQQNPNHTREPARRLRLWKTKSNAALSNDPSNVQAKAGYSAALKASFKSLWLEKEVKVLREQWEQCVRDFNLGFMRLDTKTRFQALQQISEGNSTILNALQSDLHILVEDVKDANLKGLGSFLDDYTSHNSVASKESRNCEYILKSLEFPGMEARRDQIQHAARGTFTWLLEEESIPDGHDGLETSLKEWLTTRAGVYHITGKPGSGKSTLMKLVGESFKSHEYLRDWARRDQKQLITVNFFTWKAAESNRLQNKVEGMIRTLLHQILTLEPGLISMVFPEHWHPETYYFGCAFKENRLRWPEIQNASERIFGSPLLIGKYRIFLLIDGMDEFDDPGEPHFQIAKRVKEWCGRNPDNVKACISSREDSPFMDAFPAHQRLRLHLITSRDIRRLTEQRLMEHPHFASSFFTHEQRAKLLNSVTDQAEGVFLWVVLTIVELTHRLDARQGFDLIHEVVKDSNQNLNSFIKEILSRIPDTYTKDAQHLFRIVQFTTRTSFELDVFHVHKAVTFAKAPCCLTASANQKISYEEAVAEVEEFKARLPTVSRGLLELRGFRPHDNCVLAGPHARSSVSFIHRSVFGFFEENTNSIWKENLTGNSPEQLSLLIRSSVHIIHVLPWQQPKFDKEPLWHPASHWQYFIKRIMEEVNKGALEHAKVESIFPLLKALEAALLHKQCILPEDVQLDSSQWSDLHLPSPQVCLIDDTASVFLSACTKVSFRGTASGEFVSWAVKGGYPDWVRHPGYKARIARFCFLPAESNTGMWSFPPSGLPPDCLGLNEVLEADILPESNPFSSNLRGSLWLNYLVHTINLVAEYQLGLYSIDELKISAIAEELSNLLARRAEPYILFHWWPKYPDVQRSDYVSPHEKKNSPDDIVWEDRTNTGVGNSVQDDGTIPIELAKIIPSDAEFGLEVTVGTAPAIQLTQGPRWQHMQDTLLMRFFLLNFGKTKGSANLIDVLNVIYWMINYPPEMRSKYSGWHYSPHESAMRHLQSAIAGLSQKLAKHTRPEFSGIPIDCKSQQEPGDFESIYTTAQDLAGTGSDQSKPLPLLTLETLLREHMVIILPILGKHISPVTPTKKSNIIYADSVVS